VWNLDVFSIGGKAALVEKLWVWLDYRLWKGDGQA
jgi:hypothetical protein